jgi:hypothetical protein
VGNQVTELDSSDARHELSRLHFLPPPKDESIVMLTSRIEEGNQTTHSLVEYEDDTTFIELAEVSIVLRCDY